MKGKPRTFNGLSGIIKGEDGKVYHFEKEDFRSPEYYAMARKMQKRRALLTAEFKFTPKTRPTGDMPEATDIWFDYPKGFVVNPPTDKPCPSCRKSVSLKFSFCPWCGASLKPPVE